MYETQRLLAAATIAACCSASAVELSRDDRGQVILLPVVSAGTHQRSELVVRNTSSRDGKAVRVVARDPVGGLPTASLNVYLAADDAWSVQVDAVAGGDGDGRARFAPWTDGSCTFPARDALPEGMVFSAADFPVDADPASVTRRLQSASVEVFEMGTLPTGLAGDCGAIAERWAPGGAWREDPNADLTAPAGSLTASAALVDRFQARGFQYRGVALDRFRDAPLHTVSSALSPHLGDVQPAVSSTLRRIDLPTRSVLVQQDDRWDSYPVNAVNAVLMAGTAAGEFRSDTSTESARRGNAEAGVVLAFPTRAFHVDEAGVYLGDELAPQPGPFAGGELLDAIVVTRAGERIAVGPPPGRRDCDRVRASLTSITLKDSVSFGGRCDPGVAQLFVAGAPNQGRIEFAFEGRIVSDDGRAFTGRPVLGLLFQALTDPGVGGDRFATTGWATYLTTGR